MRMLACFMVLFLWSSSNAQQHAVLSSDLVTLTSVLNQMRDLQKPRVADNHCLKIVFLLKFEGFGCLTCLNEFIDMCDTLQKLKSGQCSFQPLIIFQKGKRDSVRQESQMKAWLASLGIKSPFYIRDDVFEHVEYIGSFFVIVDPQNRPIYYDEFPLHLDKQAQILNVLQSTIVKQ